MSGWSGNNYYGKYGVDQCTGCSDWAGTGRPAGNGDRSFGGYGIITNTYQRVVRPATGLAETQLELVTQPQASAVAALHALTMLTQQVRQGLLPELIWPLSMPPTLPREDRDIPIAKLDAAAVAYRQGLAHRYGRRRQMLSGVHCNVSLAASLMMGLYQAQTDSRDFTTFQNRCYLHIAQNYLHYRWLLTYLYGCSPRCWPQSGLTPPALPVRSLRNSSSGYTNRPGVTVSYASLNDYFQNTASGRR